MYYDLNDILTMDNKDYFVASTFLEGKEQYFLLIETDQKEDLNLDSIKVMKQSIFENKEPELLYPVVDESELKKVYPKLLEVMDDEE